MGVHVANGHVRTSNKGTLRQVFNFAIGAAGAVGTITQAGANFVTSVTQTATGIYTVQLNKLYPVRLIYVAAHVASPAVTDAVVVARFDSNSYSATAGTFIINTTNSDGAAAATDPANGAQVHVEIVYVDQTTGIAS